MTPAEEKAVKALERLVKIWPKTLMLASMGGTLHALRLDENGREIMTDNGGLDSEQSVWSTIDIPNTGGDW